VGEQPTEYVPPVTLTDTGTFIPVIVTGADVISVASPALVTSTNANPSGVASWPTATVMLVKVSATPPTVSVVLVWALLVAALVWRTQSVSSLDTLPGVLT
jgi:fructose-specific phosphotransferase system IIC component